MVGWGEFEYFNGYIFKVGNWHWTGIAVTEVIGLQNGKLKLAMRRNIKKNTIANPRFRTYHKVIKAHWWHRHFFLRSFDFDKKDKATMYVADRWQYMVHIIDLN